MKEELLNIGFKDAEYPGWMDFKGNGFSISFCLNNDEPYFWFTPDGSGYREDALYPYKGIEKLKALIKINEDYFSE